MDLGNALGPRYEWNNLIRRDFVNGIVVVNVPGSQSVTNPLGASFINTGNQVSKENLCSN